MEEVCPDALAERVQIKQEQWPLVWLHRDAHPLHEDQVCPAKLCVDTSCQVQVRGVEVVGSPADYKGV